MSLYFLTPLPMIELSPLHTLKITQCAEALLQQLSIGHQSCFCVRLLVGQQRGPIILPGICSESNVLVGRGTLPGC